MVRAVVARACAGRVARLFLLSTQKQRGVVLKDRIVEGIRHAPEAIGGEVVSCEQSRDTARMEPCFRKIGIERHGTFEGTACAVEVSLRAHDVGAGSCQLM